ncbi:hypothetical protein FB451DRAFT_1470855 [Mycena latifolia]|nr:hypothetical protein FB451DRAFT_1470855 [Mycena latifolia]
MLIAMKDTDDEDLRELFGQAQDSHRDIVLDRQDQVRVAIENTRLKHANIVLLQKLATYCRRDFATIPPEILLMMFRNALSPRWSLRSDTPSLVPHPQRPLSVDLRMKLSIIGVCKSWHYVGTELLYKSSETKKIFELCPNLLYIGFAPAFCIPGLPFSLLAMSSSITSLEFSGASPMTTLLFEKLEDLRIKFDPVSVVPGSKWRMPNLRRLWIYSYLNNKRTAQLTEALLDAYGQPITFLLLPNDLPDDQLWGMLDRCPAFNGLVMHNRPWTDLSPDYVSDEDSDDEGSVDESDTDESGSDTDKFGASERSEDEMLVLITRAGTTTLPARS